MSIREAESVVHGAPSAPVGTHIREGMFGYASNVAALTPPWCAGQPADLKPYAHDPASAKKLFDRTAWPKGRALNFWFDRVTDQHWSVRTP